MAFFSVLHFRGLEIRRAQNGSASAALYIGTVHSRRWLKNAASISKSWKKNRWLSNATSEAFSRNGLGKGKKGFEALGQWAEAHENERRRKNFLDDLARLPPPVNYRRVQISLIVWTWKKISRLNRRKCIGIPNITDQVTVASSHVLAVCTMHIPM